MTIAPIPDTPIPPVEEKAEFPKSARLLAHDLSNALEIVIQTSFLLGTLDLGENGKEWLRLLDVGVQQATALNRHLRDALRTDIS